MTVKTIRRVGLNSAAVVGTTLGFVGGIIGAFLSGSGYGHFVTTVLLATLVSGISTVAYAYVYNVVARHAGGLRIELADADGGDGRPASAATGDDVVRCPNCTGLEDRDRGTCRFCGESLSSG